MDQTDEFAASLLIVRQAARLHGRLRSGYTDVISVESVMEVIPYGHSKCQ